MSRQPKRVNLTESGKKELELLANNPLFPEAAVHARIVLECAKPSTIQEIADKLSVNKNIIKKWRDRYVAEGIEGLFPQHGGGSPCSVNQLEEKITELLAEDTIWTVPELVERTGASEPAVKLVLRKLEVTLQRKRRWEYETARELVEKTIDIVGLYLSSHTRIIVLCCAASQIMIPSKGIVTTRNRAFSHELEQSLPVSLIDAMITASKYTASSHYSTFRDASAFLDDLLSGLPVNPQMEYHLVIQSSQQLRYRGKSLSNMFPVYVETEKQWLDEISHILIQLTVKDRPSFAADLTHAILQFTQASTSDSEPFIWKKQITLWKENETTLDVPIQSASVDSFPAFNEMKTFEDHLATIFPEQIADNELQCAMIAVIRSKDSLLYKIIVSQDSFPSPEAFNVKDKERFVDALSKLEIPLVKLRNDTGKQALALYMDSVKKKLLGHSNLKGSGV